MIPRRTGNLSVPRIEAACRGRVTEPVTLDRELPAARAAGFDEVEDYVAWAVIEPCEGRFDFDEHRELAAAARRAGMRWVPFLWPHAVPDWFRRGPDFRPTVCLSTGALRSSPSLFATETRAFVDRFLVAAADGLGDLVQQLVIGFPADYGEVGHATGLADWIIGRDDEPVVHYAGGEPEARGVFADLGPPGAADPPARRRRFARAYRAVVTDWTRWLLDRAGALFPRARLELKLGHGSEELRYGADWDAIVGLCASRGVLVRSTHSGLLPLLTRRVASLCRTRGAAFGTEGPRDLDRTLLRRRVFFDAVEGPAAWFEFPEQQTALAADFAAARPVWGNGPARRRAAVHYPALDLDLHPGLPISEVMALCGDALLRTCDFDLLGDSQLARGELRGDLDVFVWLDGAWTTTAAWQQLERWVHAGGTLLLTGDAPQRFADDDDAVEPPPVLSVPPGTVRDYRAAVAAPGAFRLRPGVEPDRLFLGRGWHGRDDGARAFGAPAPCRWTSSAAELVLPRPPRGAPLQLAVAADVPTSLVVELDGHLAATARVQGAAELAVVPASAGAATTAPLLSVRLRARPLRPLPPAERRDLGVLVRSIGYGDGHDDAGLEAFARAVRWRDDAGAPCGRGRIVRLDGTPFGARAALCTFVGARPDGGYRAEFAAGTLLHNPDGRRGWRPDGPIGDGGVEVPPFATRWVPRPHQEAVLGDVSRPTL